MGYHSQPRHVFDWCLRTSYPVLKGCSGANGIAQAYEQAAWRHGIMTECDIRSFGPGDDEPSSDSDGDSSTNPSSGSDDDMGHDGTGDNPSDD